MTYILIQGTVEDYEKWKPVFDQQALVRKAAGSSGGYVFRSLENPNQVVILLEWDNLEKGRAFAASDTLRTAMQRAGVVGAPTVRFLEEADRPSA